MEEKILELIESYSQYAQSDLLRKKLAKEITVLFNEQTSQLQKLVKAYQELVNYFDKYIRFRTTDDKYKQLRQKIVEIELSKDFVTTHDLKEIDKANEDKLDQAGYSFETGV